MVADPSTVLYVILHYPEKEGVVQSPRSSVPYTIGFRELSSVQALDNREEYMQ